MIYKIRTINLNAFLWIVILGVILTAFGSFLLAVHFQSPTLLVIFLPIVIAIFIISQMTCRTDFEFKIDNGTLTTNLVKVDFNEIKGYYIDENVSMSAFNFLLQNGNIYRHTITTSGKWKSLYFDFINDFKSIIKSDYPDVKYLEYSDVYPKSGRFVKNTVYVGIPIVILIDLITLITYLQGNTSIPYQVLIVNIYLLVLIPYVRKNKR